MTQRRVQSGRPVRVLQSYIGPGPQTNPYIIQLHDALAATPGVSRRSFSWRTALLGDYDVFHVHWPEALITKRGRISTLGRQTLYALILAKLWLLRIPVVRTVHNLDLPQGIDRVERWLLEWTERLTRMRILLNDFTPVPAAAASALIEHGHYRDWFARYPAPAPLKGRILFFGKVRRYKNVEGLLRVFREIADPTLRLRVAGSPSSTTLTDALYAAAGDDPRIGLQLGFVEDPDLVRAVSESQLVALPYSEMHNSGSVLAALSLNRPVLVPDNAFNRALAREVGVGWVIRYEGDLTPAHIEQGLAEASALTGRPDLSLRDWTSTGARHLDAYRRAITRRRG